MPADADAGSKIPARIASRSTRPNTPGNPTGFTLRIRCIRELDDRARVGRVSASDARSQTGADLPPPGPVQRPRSRTGADLPRPGPVQRPGSQTGADLPPPSPVQRPGSQTGADLPPPGPVQRPGHPPRPPTLSKSPARGSKTGSRSR